MSKRTVEVDKDHLQPGDWVKFTYCGYRVEAEVYDPYANNPDGDMFAGGVWIVTKNSWRNLVPDSIKFVSAIREVHDRKLPTKIGSVVRWLDDRKNFQKLAILHGGTMSLWYLNGVYYSAANLLQEIGNNVWEELVPKSDSIAPTPVGWLNVSPTDTYVKRSSPALQDEHSSVFIDSVGNFVVRTKGNPKSLIFLLRAIAQDMEDDMQEASDE